MPARGGSPAAMEGRRSTSGSTRTRWWSRMAERWSEVDRPRACAARRGAAPAATAEELAGVGGRWLAAAWSTNESVRTTRSPQLGLRWPKDGWPWSFGGDGSFSDDGEQQRPMAPV